MHLFLENFAEILKVKKYSKMPDYDTHNCSWMHFVECKYDCNKEKIKGSLPFGILILLVWTSNGPNTGVQSKNNAYPNVNKVNKI
jgi:hypothetical protein